MRCHRAHTFYHPKLIRTAPTLVMAMTMKPKMMTTTTRSTMSAATMTMTTMTTMMPSCSAKRSGL